MVAFGDVDVVSECLRSIDGVEFAIWFGSSCRGRVRKFSDLDIGIYVSRDLSVRELMNKIPFLERLVDLKILNDAPPPSTSHKLYLSAFFSWRRPRPHITETT
ncbi:MAG: nucleotidyltransferase domain-containing protein [Candidatus Jordarchaeales archaeon]